MEPSNISRTSIFQKRDSFKSKSQVLVDNFIKDFKNKSTIDDKVTFLVQVLTDINKAVKGVGFHSAKNGDRIDLSKLKTLYYKQKMSI